VAKFVIEDGTGKPDANAYMTVQWMIDYFAEVGVDLAGWDAATKAQPRIVIATRALVAMFRDQWQGRRTKYDQALDWPRYGVILDRDMVGDMWMPGIGSLGLPGFLVGSADIPDIVKAATAELAYRADLRATSAAQQGAGILVPDIEPGAMSVISESVGPISVSYAPGINPVPVYTYVKSILRPLLARASNQVSIVRA
jgi:hypothetical protein